MLGRWVTRIVDAQARWATPFGDFNHRWLTALFGSIRPVKDFLNGTWLGHPVHAALTDLPIGVMTVAIVLDIIGQRVAADVAVLKVQPLGGVRACLWIAQDIGLPVVVEYLGHNEVLDRRLGIPITLSMVYIEIGQRLGLALRGVSFTVGSGGGSVGIGEVAVYRALRVAFFSTGDELKSIGTPLAAGEIYDSNRYTLYGMLTRLGCDIIDMGIVRDAPRFVQHYIRHRQGREASILHRLAKGAADIPTIVLGTPGLKLPRQPAVFIPVGTPGVDHAGRLVRCDSVVSLPLKNLHRAELPRTADVLAAIEAAL